MIRFLRRGFLYSLPLFFAVFYIGLIDPYSLFGTNRSFDQLKFNIGYSYDQGRRYKIFSYFNNPTDKIILGASEINVINEHNIPEGGWHSLSFGGAPLRESLDLFWKVAEDNELKKVIFAPEFIKYYTAVSFEKDDIYSIDHYNWNATQSFKALDLYRNKPEYFVDEYTIKSSYSYFMSKIGIEYARGIPQMTKNEFWSSQLSFAKKTYCENRTVNKTLQKEIFDSFQRIKIYAESKGIEIKIIIPIQHYDLIALEFDCFTYKYYYEYLSMLISIFNKVYFFDYPNDISCNRELFSDPFHYSDSNIYIDAIWNGNYKYCKVLTVDNCKHFLDSVKLNVNLK